MRPRVHATFELFTLGFVVILVGNEKTFQKRNNLINCSGKEEYCKSAISGILILLGMEYFTKNLC